MTDDRETYRGITVAIHDQSRTNTRTASITSTSRPVMSSSSIAPDHIPFEDYIRLWMLLPRLFDIKGFVDSFLGSAASPTKFWLSWVAIIALFAFFGCFFNVCWHSRQLRKAATVRLPKSDNFRNDYVLKRLKEMGADGEEDGRVLLVLRVGLWTLLWLIGSAIAFFWAGETRGIPQKIEDGSFIFRNNEGFTAALALIIALASSAMAPIYVELLNRRRAADLKHRAAFERLQQSLRQTSQRMEAIWNYFEDVLSPFTKNWLTNLADVPRAGPEISLSARSKEATFRLDKRDIESVAESFSELLHGDALFKSYLKSGLMAPEDRSAFFFLLRRWRSEGRRVPWGDEFQTHMSEFYRSGTVFTADGQCEAEKKLLSITDTDSPLHQVRQWAETGKPDFLQSEKTDNYKVLRDLREGWVTAHAFLVLPKRDIRGPNSGQWQDNDRIKPGDWYAWVSDGQSLCVAPDGSRRREVDDYYSGFSKGIEHFFPSSETTLVPLIRATDAVSARMGDQEQWSVRSLWQLQRELEQRMRYHLEILEQSVANVKLAGEELGLNVESLLDDVELFRALCPTLDHKNSSELKGKPAEESTKTESRVNSVRKSTSADRVVHEWVVADLARLLYYGIVLRQMKKKQESNAVGEMSSTWQLVEKYQQETLTQAKQTFEEASITDQPQHVSRDKWDTVRRILEASRARSAVHILSRAALSARRREKLVVVKSDFFSTKLRVRSEIRLAVLQRCVGMPVEPMTRLRLTPITEIDPPEPPQFLNAQLDEIVSGVLKRQTESAATVATEQR